MRRYHYGSECGIDRSFEILPDQAVTLLPVVLILAVCPRCADGDPRHQERRRRPGFDPSSWRGSWRQILWDFANRSYPPCVAGNILLTISMAAGPTSTTKMPGKMNNTSGKISFTAVLAAFSSANCRRLVRIESLCTRSA